MSNSPDTPLANVFRGVVGWLWLFSSATNLLLLAAPVYMIQIYSRILPSNSLETLLFLTLIVVATLAVYGFLEALRSSLAQKLSARYELTATKALLEGGLVTPDGAADTIHDASIARQFFGSRAFVALFDLPFAPLFLGLMFFAHPILGLIVLGGMAVLVGLAVLNKTSVGDSLTLAGNHQALASRYAGAALNQNEDIRAMGMAPQMVGRWFAQSLQANAHADTAGVWNARYFGASRFFRQALQISILGVGAYLVLAGEMSGGLIFAASLLSGRALAPIEQVIGNWRQVTQGIAAHRNVRRTLTEHSSVREALPLELPEPVGNLTLENMSLELPGYPNAVTLIDDVTLDVAPGEILVVMGPSGAGKSTLARLMVGIMSPTKGVIRLDGFALHQWDPGQRGSAIGYIGQFTDVPDGTVAETISRFSPDADDNDIVRAAQRAHAHDFIAQLPEGYNTVVGHQGLRLSGGQIQRLALARALYGGPKLLVLDEPNAHLDRDGEAALLAALEGERQRGCAIVVISQRDSILEAADRIAIFENGQLVSVGPVARGASVARGPSDLANAKPGLKRFEAKITNFRRVPSPASANEASALQGTTS